MVSPFTAIDQQDVLAKEEIVDQSDDGPSSDFSKEDDLHSDLATFPLSFNDPEPKLHSDQS